MTDPFIGEIRINAFDYAPNGWASCNGQSLPIRQNAALYSLIAPYFGYDTNNFNLPDLRGRSPLGYATNSATPNGLTQYAMGAKGGTETVTLTTAQFPAHTHQFTANKAAGNSVNPAGCVYAQSSVNIYAPATSSSVAALNNATISSVGGNASHSNMQPYLVLNFCIALLGYYPPRQ